MKKRICLILIGILLLVIPFGINAQTCPRITKENVKIYFSGDYGNESYCTNVQTGCNGKNNLCTSGCYPLTISSVLASYGLNVGATDVSKYLCQNFPDYAQGRQYAGNITNNAQFHNDFNMNITQIGSSGDNVDDLLRKVDETLAMNKMVMASIKKGGPYSSGAHYLALAFKENDQYYLLNTGKRDTVGFISASDVKKNILGILNAGLYEIYPKDCSNLTIPNGTGSGGNINVEDYYDIFGSNEDTGCDTIFMTDGELNEFGEFLDGVYLFIKVAAPVLVIVLSTIDYLKAIASSNADEIKKCNKRTITRLIIGIIIFFLPYLLDLLFHMFGLYDISRCNIGT